MMRRPLAFRLLLIAAVLIAAIVALSFVDPTKTPMRVEKPIAENALAK